MRVESLTFLRIDGVPVLRIVADGRALDVPIAAGRMAVLLLQLVALVADELQRPHCGGPDRGN